jgi:hypothetical protein
MTDDTAPEPAQPATPAPAPAPRRRRLTAAPVAPPAPPAPPLPEVLTRPYVVVGGPISPRGGVGNLVKEGEVVHLTAAQARHYHALGRLAPVIEDD